MGLKYEKKKITLPMFKVIFHFASHVSAYIAIAFLIGCSPDEPVTPLNELNYFPLRVGDFRVYKIDETKITPYDVAEKFNYEIKTVVSDSFLNNAGTYSYIIQRYKRAMTSPNWQSLDTWTARMDELEVVVNEGNIPYLKIQFPLVAGKEWNGNAYNNEESNEFCEDNDFASCDLYSYGKTMNAFTTSGGLTFDNTIEVIENNNLDLIVQRDVRKEIYAWEVGLIYREINVLKYCTVGICSGKQIVEDGLVYKQELIQHGHQ